MNTHNATLDLNKKPYNGEPLRIGQNDQNAPILAVSVTDGGQPFTLTGWTAKFKMRKPSGGEYSVTGTVSGSTATFSLSGMEPGTSDIAYVLLEKDDVRVSTQRIRVEVLEGANA